MAKHALTLKFWHISAADKEGGGAFSWRSLKSVRLILILKEIRKIQTRKVLNRLKPNKMQQSGGTESGNER